MRTPKDCAAVLAELHRASFGGEDGGAYRISRDDLKTITGRPVIHQTIIEDVADWLVERGLILIDRDAFFVVMRPAVLEGLREATGETLDAFRHPVDFGGSYED